MNDRPTDLPRIVFATLIMCGLIVAALWILAPFAAAIVWATTIVVATWPVILKLQKLFGGRRGWATTVMTILLLLVVVLPFVGAFGTILAHREAIAGAVEKLRSADLPPAPDWLGKVPLVGEKAAAKWGELASGGAEEFAAQVGPYARQAMNWLLSTLGSVGALLGQLLLTVIVAAVFYSIGDGAALRLRRFARRIAGDRGDQVVVLAGSAIRGVALGVVVTAVGQSVLAGLGMALAGVPFAAVLTIVALVLCIAQIGPILVLIPAIAFLYMTGHTGSGTFLLVWSIPVVTMDNVVRPILIKKGADLPLLLIFSGVVGGLVSLGLIGIFVGPVVLAVGHTLLDAWIGAGEAPLATDPEKATPTP